MNITVSSLLVVLLSIPYLVQIKVFYKIQLFREFITPPAASDGEEYDFIVVGAGSAGSTITGRLIEKGHNVLLIEAGGWPHYLHSVPGLCSMFATGDPEYMWQYVTEPQTHCCHGNTQSRLKMSAGKTLGGGSQLNYMLYVRGSTKDYDEWEDLGNPGWGWKSVLPFFTKAERLHDTVDPSVDEEYHGKDGRLWVTQMNYTNGFSDLTKAAAQEMGYKYTDYNGKHQDDNTLGRSQVTQKNGFRADAFSSYILDPGLDSKENFKLITYSQVTRLLFKEGSQLEVIGVEIERFGQILKLYAKNEVVLSAGSIGSSKIMLLSGLGPKEEIEKVGIELKKEIPGVGRNLQDHPAGNFHVYPAKPLPSNFVVNVLEVLTPMNLIKKFLGFKGILENQGVGHMGFFDSGINKMDKYNRADIQLFAFSSGINGDYGIGLKDLFGASEEYYHSVFDGKEDLEVATFVVTVLRSKTRGKVSLRSSNPKDLPILQYNALSDPHDMNTMIQAMKIAYNFTQTEAFKQNRIQHLVEEANCGHHKLFSDHYFQCLLEQFMGLLWHPVGTCKMGPKPDKMAVVDHRLKVHDVKRLRIADGSIMPIIVGGNTNAACIMIGEKAADMILKEWPVDEQKRNQRPAQSEL